MRLAVQAAPVHWHPAEPVAAELELRSHSSAYRPRCAASLINSSRWCVAERRHEWLPAGSGTTRDERHGLRMSNPGWWWASCWGGAEGLRCESSVHLDVCKSAGGPLTNVFLSIALRAGQQEQHGGVLSTAPKPIEYSLRKSDSRDFELTLSSRLSSNGESHQSRVPVLWCVCQFTQSAGQEACCRCTGFAPQAGAAFSAVLVALRGGGLGRRSGSPGPAQAGATTLEHCSAACNSVQDSSRC